jgi:Flp pilus assembly protein TadG
METLIKRRKRNINNRSPGGNFNLCGYGGCYYGNLNTSRQDDAQHICRPDYRHHVNRVLKDQRGGAIDFVIVSTLLLFMVFASIDYFVTFTQHQIAQHITNYYLERVRIEGRLTRDDETEMRNRFTAARMTVDEVSGPREAAGNPVVTRNTDDPDASKITMTITLKPADRPFVVGRLVGGNAAGDEWRIKTGGTVLSEHI